MKALGIGSVLFLSAIAGACGGKGAAPPPTPGIAVTGADAATTAPPATPDATSAPADAAATAPPTTAPATSPTAADATVAPADAAAAPTDAAATDATPTDVAAAPTAPLPAAEIEQRIMALKECKLEGYSIDRDCPQAQAVTNAMKVKDALQNLPGGRIGFGLKLLANESPTLRVKGAELLSGGIGASNEGREAILAAYPNEKNTNVRMAYLRVIGNDAAKHPKVGELLIAALEDPERDVQGQAIYAIASRWNRKFAEGPKTLEKLARTGKDMTLRRGACEYAGNLGDEALLEMYKDLTGPKVEPQLQAACMRGLVAMWADFPLWENASEKAYKLTIELLERKPRTKDMPAWTAIHEIGRIGTVNRKGPEEDAKKEGWKNRVRSWYQPRVLRAALQAIVLDPAADDVTAANAVESLAALGATTAELELLQKKLTGTPRIKDGGLVETAFDKVLGGMAPPTLDKSIPRMPPKKTLNPKVLPKDIGPRTPRAPKAPGPTPAPHTP